MAQKVSVTIVGPGSLGGALAGALHAAGFAVPEIVFHGDANRARRIAASICAKTIRFRDAQLTGGLVWICAADGEIASTAKALAGRVAWKGKYVFHSSGALSSDELKPLQQQGAKVASVHPMMSFVRSAKASFENVAFALEGDAAAIRLAAQVAREMSGNSFILNKKDKPLYHALGAFSSPLLVAHLAAAEKIGRELGLKPEQTRRVIAPILQKTLQNYMEHGSAAALSGPMVRGDVQTIASHLTALKRVPGAGVIYRALVKVALDELPVMKKAAILKLL